MKFAILAMVFAMIAITQSYFIAGFNIGRPVYAYPGYYYRKTGTAAATYDYTNDIGDQCVCTPAVPPNGNVDIILYLL